MISSLSVITPETSNRRPCILLAEDDEAAASMLDVLLGSAGYDVVIARDGTAALQRLEEMPSPDIILLDWMLPEMTGLEVCRRIRERRDPLSLPILMVTARSDSASISSAFEAGANDYITKPFLGAELRARIAAHLRVKQLSDERRAMDEHLMERDKLATLGLLVSGVAHDLNNPLGGIHGWAQLLLEQETDVEKLVALDAIISEVKRCNRIVADLLSFVRRQSPERLEVDVAEILTRTLELRDRHLQSVGVVPRLALEPALPVVIGDAQQLQQVFVNLLVNAEHALRDAGSILRISAERRTCEDGMGCDWVAVRFYNDGPAIPQTLVSRIFDPFFTTKDRDEGTGLGLAICRRIAREHGGDVEVESGEEGTTFTVLLPVMAGYPEAFDLASNAGAGG
jgi:signal transduction histidine kinase